MTGIPFLSSDRMARWTNLQRARYLCAGLTRLVGLSILLAGVVTSQPASAACANPPGNAADQIYNLTCHTWQFCNGSSWVAFGPTRSFSCGGSTTFTYTGTDQSFTVPAGVTSITIKMWGAGGGGGNNDPNGYPAGAGGYATGTLSVSAGQVYTIIVGQGGVTLGASTYGGGGNGGFAEGAGGGRSAIRLSTTELMTPGGAGGGTTGVNAFAIQGGLGGSQSAGGGAGTGGYTGLPGTQYTGGGAPTWGGGGWYGGVSGAADAGFYGGGGGGSSYIGGTGVSGASTTAGSGVTPPNIGDTSYVSGVGGAATVTGGNGEVVISW